MNHAISGEILADEVRFPQSEIFFATLSQSLSLLDLDKWVEGHEYLYLQFAKKSIKNRKMKDLFPLKDKKHEMMTRSQEIF